MLYGTILEEQTVNTEQYQENILLQLRQKRGTEPKHTHTRGQATNAVTSDSQEIKSCITCRTPAAALFRCVMFALDHRVG